MAKPNLDPTPRSAKSDPKEEPRRLDLHATLQHIHDGYYMEEAHAKFHELVEHIVKRGGEGTLTLTLKCKRADGGINLTADVAAKLPKRISRAQFLYADEKGETYQDDPHQTELEFPAPVVFGRPDGGERSA